MKDIPFSDVLEKLRKEPQSISLSGFCSAENGQLAFSGRWKKHRAGSFGAFDTSQTFPDYVIVDYTGVGIYSCWDIRFDSGESAGLIVLDMDFNAELQQLLFNANPNEPDSLNFNEESFKLVFHWIFNQSRNHKISYCGDLELSRNPVWSQIYEDSGLIVVGEPGEGIDSRFPLFTFDHFNSRNTKIHQIYELNEGSPRTKSILISSEGAASALSLTEVKVNGKAHSQVVFAPFFEATSIAAAVCSLNRFLKLVDLKAMERLNVHEGLIAMTQMQMYSWGILQDALDTREDFEFTLEKRLSDLGANWKVMVRHMRGQNIS